MQTSTKPYLYYEQIINGLVDVPKRVQKYLGDAIVLKNEQRKAAEVEQEKVNEQRLDIEQPPDDTGSKNISSLFKFPLFGWFSSNTTTKAPEQPSESESESDKEVEVPLFGQEEPKVSEKEPYEKEMSDKEMSDKEPSNKEMSDKEPSNKEMSEKEPSDNDYLSEKSVNEDLSEKEASDLTNEVKNCNIRNWQKLKVE